MTGGRIVVTDVQERAMLAAVRCLRTCEFRVIAVATTQLAPGLWSWAPAVRRVGPDPRRDIAGFIDRLEEIVRDGRCDGLLAGTDASLLAVSRHRERLEPYVRLRLPPHEVVERALDKQQVAHHAAEVGLAAPEARVCRSAEEAAAAAAAFGYPVLVKPVRTVDLLNGAAQRWASVIARGAADVETAARSFEICIVQERVKGPVISFGGVATGRRVLAWAVSRYARTWPADGGNVSFSESIVPPAGLAAKVQALVERLEWSGLFELELIERGDGRLCAIDFNPRAYGSMALAVAAGVPLPALWCEWLLNGRPREAHARPGVRYRWEDADLRNFGWCLLAGRARDALAVARPRRRVAHAYFQLRDPVPAAARAVQIMRLVGERRGRQSVLRRIREIAGSRRSSTR